MATRIHPIVAQIVGRVHVSTSNLGMLRYLRSRFTPAWRHATTRSARRSRKAIYRQAIRAHVRNRALFITCVMRGF